jgi:hypothetical protein
MRKCPRSLIIFLIAITTPPSTSSASIPTGSFTPTITPTITPDTPQDPIVGSWLGYSYPPNGGRLKKVYTFWENNSWMRKTTNLKSRVQAYWHGTWRKENDKSYLIKTLESGSTATFQFDLSKEELFDPTYQDTFHRTSESPIPVLRVPSLNITLHGAEKVSKLQGVSPFSGNKFLIVNISINNTNETGGYSFDEISIRVLYDEGSGSYSINSKNEGRLSNPLPFGTIALGETRQGNVIFGVPEKSESYTLKLVDSEGDTVSNIIELRNVEYAPTNSSETD